MKFKIVCIILISVLLSSCKTRQSYEKSDINYMQNIEHIAIETSVRTNYLTIQPGDHLVIFISARDLDVVKPYNQNYSSSEVLQNTVAGGNIIGTQPSVSGPTYIVDSNGEIDFPGIGRLNTTGKSIEEFKNELRGRLTKYIINPTVSMRLANYKVTVLGEVNKPGQYAIADGQTTLLNAIGLAGDLTLFGKRDDILIVRNQDGIISKDRVNITDASFLNSPYYNLKQGDVIYVSANQNRELTSKQNPNTNLYISVASVILGVLGILVSILKK